MPRYRVTATCLVPYTGSIEVEAESPEAAREAAYRSIYEDADPNDPSPSFWEGELWNKEGAWEADFGEARYPKIETTPIPDDGETV